MAEKDFMKNFIINQSLCLTQKKTPFFCLWTISLSCCFASANFIHTSGSSFFHGDLIFPDSTIPSTFSHQMEGRAYLSRRAATKNIKNPDGKLNFWPVTLSRSATLWNFLVAFWCMWKFSGQKEQNFWHMGRKFCQMIRKCWCIIRFFLASFSQGQLGKS